MKIVFVIGHEPLTIFAKKLHVDLQLGSKYASVNITLHVRFFRRTYFTES